MAKTPAKSDSEIIHAYRVLHAAMPDREVSGSRMQKYFGGVGHPQTYTKHIERLQSLGSLPVHGADPNADVLTQRLSDHIDGLVATMREAAQGDFNALYAQEKANFQRQQEALSDLLSEVRRDNEQLALKLEQSESVSSTRDKQLDTLRLELHQLREEHRTLRGHHDQLVRCEAKLSTDLEATTEQRDHLLTQLTTLEQHESDVLKRQSDDHARATAALRAELTELRGQLAVANSEKVAQASQCASMAEQLKTAERQRQAALDDPEKWRLTEDNGQLRDEITQLRDDVRTAQKTLQEVLSNTTNDTPRVLQHTDTTLTVAIGRELMRYHCPDHEECDTSAFADFDTRKPVVMGDNLVFYGSGVSLALSDFETVAL